MMIDTGEAGVPVNGKTAGDQPLRGRGERRQQLSPQRYFGFSMWPPCRSDVDVSSSVISRADGGRGGLPED